MPSKLLSVAALFGPSIAVASPPVDTERVTGNINTEHQARQTPAAIAVALPPIDTCRVTGNIVTHATKGSGQETMCRLANSHYPVSLDLVTREGQSCVATGTPVKIDAVDHCRISEHITVPLPADAAAPARSSDPES